MEENNKLLAEFLGITFKDNRFECDTLYNELIKENSYITFLEEVEEIDVNNHLHFHSDWGWLMLVVDKIENQHNRTVQIERGICYIHNGGIHHGRSTKVQTKIEAVYNACVDFVEWWNKENN